MNSEKVSNYIVNWLKSYAEKANVNGFVVGVSGGIDSAVTSTLCALTGLKTICVEMPIHQSENQVTRAQEHIKQLKERFSNVCDERVDLTDSFDVFKSLFKSDPGGNRGFNFGEYKSKVTYDNIVLYRRNEFMFSSWYR